MREDIKLGRSAGEFWTAEGCYIKELLNDASDPAASIAEARVPAGGTTRWHRLHGIAERYVLLAGEGEVEVGDLPATRVGAGDVVLIPAGVRQRIANVGGVDLVFLAICTPRFQQSAYEDVDPTPMPAG